MLNFNNMSRQTALLIYSPFLGLGPTECGDPVITHTTLVERQTAAAGNNGSPGLESTLKFSTAQYTQT